MEQDAYVSVSALTKYLKYRFDHDNNLQGVLLEGEISNFKHNARGHFYFTLKDEGAQISATMFYGEARKVLFEPADGMKVLVKGDVTVYEPYGTYSINVHEIEQKGIGSLYVAYEKLKKDLEKKGFFDQEHKKPIPKYPKAIGVITSGTGAAVRDCINTISRRYPMAEIYVYPTIVQGDDSKFDVVSKIELANRQKLVDVLIVGRGGGSIEDLWAFNEEIVAKAIYNSELPIISGVGHETDTTIADYVADRRAATPTAAAELATPNIVDLRNLVDTSVKRINTSMINYLKNLENKLVHLDSRLDNVNPVNKLDKMHESLLGNIKQLDLAFKSYLDKTDKKLSVLKTSLESLSPRYKLESMMNKVKEYENILDKDINKVINDKAHELSILNNKLDLLNPLKIMDKGYSIVYKDEKIVKSISDVNVDDTLKVTLQDGSFTAIVKEKENGR